MKIAIATDGNIVSAHFGRCPVFTLIDIEDGSIKQEESVGNPGHEPGRIPQFLYEKNVECIVCGGMGARAQGFFREYNINIVTGVEGTIENTIELLKQNTLKSNPSLCHPGAGKGYGLDKKECDHEREEH